MQIFILDKNGYNLCALSSTHDNLNSFNFYEGVFTRNLLTPSVFEFRCPLNHENSKYIELGNQVIFKYKGKYHLFKITEVEASHSQDFSARCYCEGASLELINTVVMPATMNSATPTQALNTILTNTNWSVGEVVGDFGVKDVEFTSFNTVLTEVQNLATLFGAELEYRIDFVAGVGVKGRYIDFKTNVGTGRGIRFEYGVNTSDVVKIVNDDNICTAVIPIGNENLTITNIECLTSSQGFNKPKGVAYVALTDEERSKLVSTPYHVYSTLSVETDDPYALAVKAWEYLQNNKVPIVTYTCNPVLISDDIEVGDEVYCIDREMGIQIEATVSEMYINFNDHSLDTVTLTNYIEVESKMDKELIEAIRGQLENLDIDTNVIISDQRPDGTIDNPFVWVDTSDKELAGTEIWNGQEWIPTLDKNTLTDAVEDAKDTLKDWILNNGEMKILFQSIPPVDVSDKQIWIDTSTYPYVWKRWNAETNTWEELMESTEELSAFVNNSVQQTVDELNGKIEDKVSRTEFEHQGGEFESRLSLAESSISQTADEIKSKVSKDSYDLDMDALKSRVTVNESSIIQTAQAISSKVSAGDIASTINQTAQSVLIDASKINFNGISSFTNNGSEGKITISNGSVTSSPTSTSATSATLKGGELTVVQNAQSATLASSALMFESPSGDATIYGDSGQLYLTASYGVGIRNPDFSGTVDFTGCVITGWDGGSEGISVSTTGSGNGVTGISYSNGVLTVNSGRTFSISGHTHSGYASSSHTHSEYSVSGHTHSNYSLSGHNHSTSASGSGNGVTSISSSGGVINAYSGRTFSLSGHTHSTSDARIKTNIKDIDVEKCVKLINGLEVKTFNYTFDINSPKMGVIAQEVIQFDHQELDDTFTDMLVLLQDDDNYTEDKILAVDYPSLINPLIVTVQEQQKQIDELKQLVNQLLNK